jgi:hypothetical protein
MNDNESTFPIIENHYGHDGEVLGIECTKPDMTLKEYAAIRLKVPQSGDAEIDGMIRESVRRDFAEKALRIIIDKDMNFPDALHHNWMEYAAEQSFVFADAMLAGWEKEAEK